MSAISNLEGYFAERTNNEVMKSLADSCAETWACMGVHAVRAIDNSRGLVLKRLVIITHILNTLENIY